MKFSTILLAVSVFGSTLAALPSANDIPQRMVSMAQSSVVDVATIRQKTYIGNGHAVVSCPIRFEIR